MGAIATWRSDLNRVLHVFNVRSVGPILLSLTFPLQTELAINTNVVVSNLYRGMVMSQGGTDGLNRSVSTPSHPSTTECLLSPRLKLGQLSRMPSSPWSYFT